MPRETESNTAAGGKTSAPPAKRRRRRLRGLIVLLLLLVTLVAAAPYLLSTDAAVGLMTALINDRIHGRIDVDELSLAWFSPCHVRGLRVTDRADREVLRIKSIRLAGGLAARIASGAAFERLDIDSPSVAVHQAADGRISLVEALSPRERDEAEDEDDSDDDDRLPNPKGRVVVREASVLIVRPDGREYRLHVDSDMNLTPEANLVGRTVVNFAEGGAMSVDFQIDKPLTKRDVRTRWPSGALHVETFHPVRLSPIGRFALDEPNLDGNVLVTAAVSLRRAELSGDFDVQAASLRASRGGREATVPLDLRLKGTLTATRERIEGSYALAGDCGRLAGSFRYLIGRRPPAVSGEQVIAALLTGGKLALGDFTLDANGQIDLAKLARAVPALLRIRPDVAVTSGTLTVKDVSLRGGDRPAARGDVRLTGLAAERGERTIRWQPVVATFDTEIVPGEGLRVGHARVRADFATLDANGTPRKLIVGYSADLARLCERLGEIFDLGDLKLRGATRGSLDLSVPDRRRGGFRFATNLTSLEYSQGERRLAARAASLTGSGTIEWPDPDAAPVITAAYALAADDELALKGSARVEPSRGDFQTDATVERGVLGGLVRKAKGLGAEVGVDVAGELSGSVSLRRDSAAGPLISSGGLTVRDLLLDGNSIGKEPVRASWTDVRYAPEARKLAVKEAALTGEPASIVVKDLSAGLGEELDLAGSVSLSADLARCAAVAARFRREEKPPEIAGRLTWSGTAGRAADGSVALAGSGSVAGFVVGSGETAVRVEPLAFRQAVRVDAARETIDVEGFRVDCDPLALRAAGTVRRYRTEQLLAITGHYKGDWQRLLAVAHRLLPDTKDFALTGPVESDFRLTGPASRPKLRPVFRDLRADAGVGWASARYAGFSLGEAKLPVRLVDGRVEVLPVTAVAASGGKVRLGGTVDLGAELPVFRLPGETVVLENVPVNREVAEKLLSRFNPIFARLVSLEGRVTMSLRDVSLPLSEEIKRSGTAAGRLDLSGMKAQPGGLLATLLALGGITAEKAGIMEVGGVDFLVRNGAIHYDDFTVVFDKTFELKFRGAVRFDDELDLAVSIPVRSALLRRFGVRGRVDDYARMLEGVRVEFPILGTRLAPKPDLAQVDVRPLVKKAMEALLKGEAGRLLDDLLKQRGEDKPGPRQVPPEKPTTKPAPKKPEEEVLEGVFDLLNDLLKQKKKDKE